MTGFQSKREMAQERTSMKDEALKLALEALTILLENSNGEQKYSDAIEALAQPVQPERLPAKWTPEEIEDGYVGIRWVNATGVHARPTPDDVERYLGYALAQPEERNFCPRCGKRTADIHTCTPPQENA